MISFIFSTDVLTVIVNGSPVHIRKESPLFSKACELLSSDIDEHQLHTILIQDYGKIYKNEELVIEINNGVATINGSPVHKELQRRITEFCHMKLPLTPLINFIKKLYKNPSQESQHELLDFLCNNHLPIHEDGDFLAYKAIMSNYKDIWSETVDNTIGAIPEMPRENVDNDRSRGCSYGYHIGTIDYAKTYGNEESILIIVKVNPADVVSVPQDCACKKARVCKYHVYAHYDMDLKAPVYSDLDTPIWGEKNCQKDIKDIKKVLDKHVDNGIISIDDGVRCRSGGNIYGAKPDGTRFYNKRGPDGRFVR